MAKKIAPVAMPGTQSNRTDQGLVDRVNRIQSDAKIQNAAGGTYNSRNTLNQIASGASTEVPQPTMPRLTGSQILGGYQSAGLMTPGNASTPLSNGALGGPGNGPEINNMPIQEQSDARDLAAAMYLANPTPQLRRIVEAFNELGPSA